MPPRIIPTVVINDLPTPHVTMQKGLDYSRPFAKFNCSAILNVCLVQQTVATQDGVHT